MKAHCISLWLYPLSLKVDLQFIMEDFSVAQSPGPVHQGSIEWHACWKDGGVIWSSGKGLWG